MPHQHGQGNGPRPSRLTRVRRQIGGGVDGQTGEEPGQRRQRIMIVSGSLGLAAAAGAVLFLAAIFAARQVPYSVRLYTATAAAGAPALVRVAAYDSRERVPVKVEEVFGAGVETVAGMADGAAVVRVPPGARPTLTVGSPAGRRTVTVPPLDPATVAPGGPWVKPVSAELQPIQEGNIIMPRAPDHGEVYDAGALEALKVVMYPASGRLVSNLPNTIYVWARGCPGRKVALETAAGGGELRADETGMASFIFTPTLGEKGFGVACDGWTDRIGLRERPAGLSVSMNTMLAKPGGEVALTVYSLSPNRPITVDVYRGCAWIDSRAVVPAHGEARLAYTLPAEPGVYSFELYGNVHQPGEERARAVVIVPKADPAGELRALFGGLKGAADEPIIAHLDEVLERDPSPAPDALAPLAAAPLAAAALSRLENWCGPPALVHDSYESDALFLVSQKAGVKKAAGKISFNPNAIKTRIAVKPIRFFT